MARLSLAGKSRAIRQFLSWTDAVLFARLGVRGEELEQAVVHLLEEPILDMPADLIAAQSQWAYQLATDPPPDDWNTVGFEDADWPRATAPVGYGHTLVESPLDVPHHNQARPVTSHFRRVVEVPDVAAVRTCSSNCGRTMVPSSTSTARRQCT